jgi:hypothetical protein
VLELEVRRAPIGPGHWPGPCRQARRVGRGLQGQRRAAGASARSADAKHRGGWRSRPGQCAAFRPLPCHLSARLPAHLARDDRPGRIAWRGHARCVSAGCAARRVRGNGAAGSGSRRCARAQEERARLPPPAARPPSLRPTRRGALSARSMLPLCMSRAFSENGQGRLAWRAEGAPLKPSVEKVVTTAAHGAGSYSGPVSVGV